RDVDFIATTTCTGRLTPSLDAHLISRLGCRSDIQRVHVGDTGCASAMVALQQAANYLTAFPGRRALVIAVEICSAAYFLDDRLESAVAHAICAGATGPGRGAGRPLARGLAPLRQHVVGDDSLRAGGNAARRSTRPGRLGADDRPRPRLRRRGSPAPVVIRQTAMPQRMETGVSQPRASVSGHPRWKP